MWIALVVFGAIAADLLPLPPYDAMDWKNQAAPPGAKASVLSLGGPGSKPFVYFFGADTMGRDIFTRLIFGARVSLLVGLIPPVIGLVAGIFGFYSVAVLKHKLGYDDSLDAFAVLAGSIVAMAISRLGLETGEWPASLVVGEIAVEFAALIGWVAKRFSRSGARLYRGLLFSFGVAAIVVGVFWLLG